MWENAASAYAVCRNEGVVEVKGQLIVIEGLDGSGKATQTELLCHALQKEEIPYRHISFPDYKEPSSALIKMYLEGAFGNLPEKVNAYAASSFFAVDRFASYVRFWKDFYEEGGLVVADRYATSNAVYQMGKLPKTEWDRFLLWLEDYEYEKLKLPKPDLVFYFDMPLEISQRLMSGRYGGDESRKDLHERNLAFLQSCRTAAVFATEKLGWRMIECSDGEEAKSREVIHCQVMEIVREVVTRSC